LESTIRLACNVARAINEAANAIADNSASFLPGANVESTPCTLAQSLSKPSALGIEGISVKTRHAGRRDT